MTTTKINDRLNPYKATTAPNGGCRHHTRHWIGCNYCEANRRARRQLQKTSLR